MCAKKMEYDEEELFAHTRMSLGDHIEELRGYMWSAIKGFIVAMILGFFVAHHVLYFLMAPLEKVLRQMRIEALKKEQNEAKQVEVRRKANLWVGREDLVAALHSLQSTDAKDSVPLKLHGNDNQELPRRILKSDLDSAWKQANSERGGEWVTLKIRGTSESGTTQRIKRQELADALGITLTKGGNEWVLLTVFAEQVDEEKRQVKKAELIKAEKNEGDEQVTLTNYTREDEDVEFKLKEAESEKPTQVLSALSITEPFMIWFKVSMYSGFVLASPWIFYQMWSFVAAGLYPHEKKYIHIFLPMSLVLFIAGVCLCQFVVLPLGIRWLLDFSLWLGIKPDLRLSEWFSFALLVPLIFGLAFQLPLVMFGLERVGFFDVQTYRNKRRIAIFIIFLISGLANASPDPISMVMLAAPLCILYEFGILLCSYWPRPELDLDVEESEEMVEV